MNNISVIIPVFNCWEYTKNCLDSVIPQLDKAKDQIIVVDNGSTDETQKRMKRYKKQNKNLFLLTNKTNEGFAKAINKGIKFANKDNHIVLLNNDVEFVSLNHLHNLNTIALERDNCGILGVRQINTDGNIIHAGAFKLPISQYGYSYAGGEVDYNQYRDDIECEVVNFACVHIRREVIDKVGLLDEKIFAYAEDDDYCIRVRNAGYKVYNTSDVTVLHHHNVTSIENKIDVVPIHKESLEYLKTKYPEPEHKHSVGIHSTVGNTQLYGYAKSCCNIVRGLIDAPNRDYDIRYSYLYGGRDYEPPADDIAVQDIQRFAQDADQSDIQITYGHGDMFNKNTGKYRIAFTMLETDGLPDNWVSILNKMDEVWTPTKWGKDVFENSGVKVPVYVVPLGINPYRYNPDIKPLTIERDDKRVKLLALYDGDVRRNLDTLVKAYCEEFDRNDNIALYFKVSNTHLAKNVYQDIAKVATNIHHPPIIPLVDAQGNPLMLPEYKMPSLYRAFDAFVNITSGEGWGLMAHEALACGLPVITTQWGGGYDSLKDADGNILPGVMGVNAAMKMAHSDYCHYYTGNRWAEPEKLHLQSQLRLLYTDVDIYKRAAKQGSEYVREHITWKNTVDKINERLYTISHPRSKKWLRQAKEGVTLQ